LPGPLAAAALDVATRDAEELAPHRAANVVDRDAVGAQPVGQQLDLHLGLTAPDHFDPANAPGALDPRSHELVGDPEEPGLVAATVTRDRQVDDRHVIEVQLGVGRLLYFAGQVAPPRADRPLDVVKGRVDADALAELDPDNRRAGARGRGERLDVAERGDGVLDAARDLLLDRA